MILKRHQRGQVKTVQIFPIFSFRSGQDLYFVPAFYLLLFGLFGLACKSAQSASDRNNSGILPSQQGVSLFGEALLAKEDTVGVISKLDAALKESPNDVERIIASARVRRNFWQYRQAIDLYSKAIELSPKDWRAYRFRGHRYISVREFESAIEDLEKARDLAPMNWDVSYHLGLAYFVSGSYAQAANEYQRCLKLANSPEAKKAQDETFRSCSQNADDPESMVAMTEWAVRALLRSNRMEEVEELIKGIEPALEIKTNVAYFHDLLFYKGLKTAEELLNPGPEAPYRRETVGFAVANWHLAKGNILEAEELLGELVLDPWWPGFGRIAAEAELYRLKND